MSKDVPIPYRTRWWREAIAETRRYWTMKRMAATVAAPVMAAVLWTIYKPWIGWTVIMQILAISILGFVALWQLIFVVSLFEAPGRLEENQTNRHKEEVALLRESIEQKALALSWMEQAKTLAEEAFARKHPHDEHKEQLVRDALDKLDEQDRERIKWLLDVGRVNGGKLLAAAGFQADFNRRAGIDLITHEPIRSASGAEIERYHQINPSYELALKNVLYPLKMA